MSKRNFAGAEVDGFLRPGQQVEQQRRERVLLQYLGDHPVAATEAAAPAAVGEDDETGGPLGYDEVPVDERCPHAHLDNGRMTGGGLAHLRLQSERSRADRLRDVTTMPTFEKRPASSSGSRRGWLEAPHNQHRTHSLPYDALRRGPHEHPIER